MKELKIAFIKQKDGTVVTSLSNNDVEFTEYELFMAYSHLEAILNKLNFDWSIQGLINSSIHEKKEEKKDGK